MITLTQLSERVSLLKITEAVDAVDITDFLRKHHEEYKNGLLVDFSESNLSLLSLHRLREIAECSAEVCTNAKTAIFSPDDVNFGVARMYQSVAETMSVRPEISIFRDMASAIDWLNL